MKRIIPLFICLLLSACASSKKPINTDWAGHYYLQGAMEVGSELLLMKDGTFEAMIVYGSANGHAKGKWSTTSTSLTLETDTPSKTRKKATKNKVTHIVKNQIRLAEISSRSSYSKGDTYELQIVTDGNPGQFINSNADAYWVYDDNSVHISNFDNDSSLYGVTAPLNPERTLNRIGINLRNELPTQWFDITDPNGLSFYFTAPESYIREASSRPEEDIALFFSDLTLHIRPACGGLALKDSNACYIRIPNKTNNKN
ncbi:hypothetical protein [Pseudomonas zhanjiangensis]|uniref:Lipoprotein n=1 Tax=Pseudomonas zhanjiangensis TaxID=3239015 RepID=A0ABV3YRI4_9PSED